jgi:hypothetical protein
MPRSVPMHIPCIWDARKLVTLHQDRAPLRRLAPLALGFTDCGCLVANQAFSLASLTPKYTLSWFLSCLGLEYNRIGPFMGFYSSSSQICIDPFTIISCIPSCWRTTGPLTLSLQEDTPAQFVSFEAEKIATAIRPFFYQMLELNLHMYNCIDPSSPLDDNAFGLSTYSYALKQNPITPFGPSVLIFSAEAYFTAL